MDSSHVSLITLVLRKEGLDHFRCDTNMTMGVKMGSLSRILKCADGGDSITLKAEEDGDSLNLVFENDKADRISDFELKLMELEAEHLDIPEEECQVVVRFSVEGDVGKGSVTLRSNDSADNKDSIKIDMKQVIEQKFALRYLTMFTKATSLSDHVVLTLTNDMPLKVEYNIEGLGSLCFYLAPKMEGDE